MLRAGLEALEAEKLRQSDAVSTEPTEPPASPDEVAIATFSALVRRDFEPIPDTPPVIVTDTRRQLAADYLITALRRYSPTLRGQC